MIFNNVLAEVKSIPGVAGARIAYRYACGVHKHALQPPEALSLRIMSRTDLMMSVMSLMLCFFVFDLLFERFQFFQVLRVGGFGLGGFPALVELSVSISSCVR